MHATGVSLRAVVAMCALLLAGCAGNAGIKAKTAAFDWSQREKKIVVIQPDITLGEVTAGGMVEPRADWTKKAQGYVAKYISQAMAKKSVAVVMAPDLTDPHDIQLVKLHAAIGQEVRLHALGPAKLPNKNDALDWTLGPGANGLREHFGADYALFLYAEDTYSTAGRVAVQAGALIACALARICVVPAGGNEIAFVSLVDLRTGNIVWCNLWTAGVGDLREDKDAGSFVDGFLGGLPL